MAKLMVTVPIRFSEKAQKDLYEICMAYKELAEMRGTNNEKLRDQLEEQKCFAADLERDVRELRELVRDLVRWYGTEHQPHEELQFWGDKSSGVYARMRKLGVKL